MSAAFVCMTGFNQSDEENVAAEMWTSTWCSTGMQLCNYWEIYETGGPAEYGARQPR